MVIIYPPAYRVSLDDLDSRVKQAKMVKWVRRESQERARSDPLEKEGTSVNKGNKDRVENVDLLV